MHTIKIYGQRFKSASTWEELNAEQLLHFALITARHGITPIGKNLLVLTLFNIPIKLFKEKLIKESSLVQMHSCLNWMFKRNTLKKWLIKSVKTGKNTYYGPKDKLSNINGEEFMFIEAEYERWLINQDDTHLDSIFAILYRRKNWFTRNRIKFNPDALDKNIEQTKNVKHYVKKATAINYAGCRNLLIEKHPDIWKKATSTDQPVSTKPTITNWASHFLQLAGDKFGTYDQTIKSKVWLLLADLNTKAKQAAELEANRK